MNDAENYSVESEYKHKIFDIWNIDEKQFVDSLSYHKLIKYMNTMHPRDIRNKKFPCCTSLGGFPGIFGSYENEITEISQQF